MKLINIAYVPNNPPTTLTTSIITDISLAWFEFKMVVWVDSEGWVVVGVVVVENNIDDLVGFNIFLCKWLCFNLFK